MQITYSINNKIYKSEEDFANRIEKESVIVSVTGHSNKGKSHLLNKLSGRNVSSRFSKKTEGFGMNYDFFENVYVSYLDS